MAIKTYIIVSPTFIQGRFAPVDTTLDLDEKDASHVDQLSQLRDAGRVRALEDLTPDELAAYKQRIEAHPGAVNTPPVVQTPITLRQPGEGAQGHAEAPQEPVPDEVEDTEEVKSGKKSRR
jgi:hypothetical protein